jgi:hypothetical protein
MSIKGSSQLRLLGQAQNITLPGAFDTYNQSLSFLAEVVLILCISCYEEADMSQMTAVEIRSPGTPFEVVMREIPDPGPNRVRIRVQACGKDIGPGSSIHASRVMRLPAWSTRLARASRRGRRANGWVWDGMAAIVVNVILAGVVTSWGVGTSR